ncbi:hypothetical protein Tco_0087075 [Tanacetum coccineum]
MAWVARLKVLEGTIFMGGAIDSSEANGIIRDPKLELENSYFTFDLIPLSYESVDVAERGVERLQELQGEGWFEWVHGDDVAKTVFRMHNGHVEVYGYVFWVNQCTIGFHGVNEPGREDVREVFQQSRSGAKRKLSRCGRNQLGNEPILALPEGADDFVVYYDARSKDLEACLEKWEEGICLDSNESIGVEKRNGMLLVVKIVGIQSVYEVLEIESIECDLSNEIDMVMNWF